MAQEELLGRIWVSTSASEELLGRGPDLGFKFGPRRALGPDLGFDFGIRSALGPDLDLKLGLRKALGLDLGFKLGPRRALGPDLSFTFGPRRALGLDPAGRNSGVEFRRANSSFNFELQGGPKGPDPRILKLYNLKSLLFDLGSLLLFNLSFLLTWWCSFLTWWAVYTATWCMSFFKWKKSLFKSGRFFVNLNSILLPAECSFQPGSALCWPGGCIYNSLVHVLFNLVSFLLNLEHHF